MPNKIKGSSISLATIQKMKLIVMKNRAKSKISRKMKVAIFLFSENSLNADLPSMTRSNARSKTIKKWRNFIVYLLISFDSIIH